MKTLTNHRPTNRRISLCVCLGLMFSLAAGPVSKAAPPTDPLPPPDYSFDLASPTVENDNGLTAGDVLVLDVDRPRVLLPRIALGLLSEDDELDALSAGNQSVGGEETFLLLFSVDRDTTGATAADPELIAKGRPFSAFDQAVRGHAAADQFESTDLYTLAGLPPGPSMNNSLSRNNYNEGGTSFGGEPPTHAHQTWTGGAQDRVDAMDELTREGPEDYVVDVYFSITANSPSLADLSGFHPPSGANIFFNQDPQTGGTTAVYADHSELGLAQNDEIDALIVFDFNSDRQFNTPDQVIFSLAPGSPSLGTIPGASTSAAAADVFASTAGTPAPVLLTFAQAGQLGLGGLQAPDDNIDALDFAFCESPPPPPLPNCVEAYAIWLPGDLNCDGDISGLDISHFVQAFLDPGGYAEDHDGDPYDQCDYMLADCNQGGYLDPGDVEAFVDILIGS